MDNRGVSAVVEKTIAIGLVALLTGTLATSLLGGAVPDYRSTVGQEVGDRVLATAASEIEAAVPSSDGDVTVRRERALPGTITDIGYTFEVENRTLRLHHPDPAVGGSTRLAVPPSVSVPDGNWSGGVFAVSVRGPVGNRSLTVTEVEP